LATLFHRKEELFPELTAKENKAKDKSQEQILQEYKVEKQVLLKK